MDALILGLRVVVALGAVLGLMWFLQRRLGKGTGRRRADRALTIVSRQSLGQKASVVVVDAAGQRFLLGVTEHTVNVLHTGDIPPEPEEIPVPAVSRSFGGFRPDPREARPLAGNHYSGSPAGGRLPTGPTGTCRRRAAAPCTGARMPAAPPAGECPAPAIRRCTGPSWPAPHGSRLPPPSGADAAIDPPAPQPSTGALYAHAASASRHRRRRERPAAAKSRRFLVVGLAAVLFAVLLLWLNATAGHAAPMTDRRCRRCRRPIRPARTAGTSTSRSTGRTASRPPPS